MKCSATVANRVLGRTDENKVTQAVMYKEMEWALPVVAWMTASHM